MRSFSTPWPALTCGVFQLQQGATFVRTSVRLPVCLSSVCLPHDPHSHAQCSKCNRWKNIAAEKWKAHEVDNTKRGRSKLLRGQCRETGCAKRSTGLLECVACTQRSGSKVALGREHFVKKALDTAKTQGSLLVCCKCKEREAPIWDKIKAVDGTGTCYCSSTWKHATKCGFLRKDRVRISRADLERLLFRKSNHVAKVQGIKYHADVGLLDE